MKTNNFLTKNFKDAFFGEFDEIQDEPRTELELIFQFNDAYIFSEITIFNKIINTYQGEWQDDYSYNEFLSIEIHTLDITNEDDELQDLDYIKIMKFLEA